MKDGVGALEDIADEERRDGVSERRIFFGRRVCDWDGYDVLPATPKSLSGSDVRRIRAGILSSKLEI